MLSGKLKTEAWATAAYSVFAMLENCEIRIYTRVKGAYDKTTNTYAPDVETTVWIGSARVQVDNMAERSISPGVDAKTQRYQFQIVRDAPALNDTMLVKITDGALQSDLEAYELHINEFFNSGGSFEKTFYATVNSGR